MKFKEKLKIRYTAYTARLKRKAFRCWIHWKRLRLRVKQHPEYLINLLTSIPALLLFILGYDFGFPEMFEVLQEFSKNSISIVVSQIASLLKRILARRGKDKQDK